MNGVSLRDRELFKRGELPGPFPSRRYLVIGSSGSGPVAKAHHEAVCVIARRPRRFWSGHFGISADPFLSSVASESSFRLLHVGNLRWPLH